MLTRNTPLLGPYFRTILGVLWWSYGGVMFLEREVPLHPAARQLRLRGPRVPGMVCEVPLYRVASLIKNASC